ncbi:indolepyruvate oxidoreductase subunit IorB [Candidatus Methanoplasma termitum]|uniref:IorB protein n=1 Tax=Candidatus Methanoplasma termitum TaxID=1577791 RepID=A0A0A7LBG3_9ARCH|nr:indolepyruvate oxidoreductase subunit beta [Candidatus Methanoplasma termitum]AIZ56414.1 indolepyruvate oxidoreductase subunit IorB [Candidatus Methanoplasma termitum]MCL2333729.1 indolepyruvate oxidoreductase subunit beta [Candidatus Methanoplasma sp.]
MRYTVQIVGVGGQGVLLASMVLGTAAMRGGHEVSMSEIHGMAQRGGSVISTLRFGDDVISPLESTGGADLIMGFEPVETCRYLSLGNKKTFVLMNLDPTYPSMVAAGFEEYPAIQGLVDSVKKITPNLKTIEATKVAVSAGKAIAANAVMIGAVAAVKGFPLKKELLKEVLLETVPEKSKDLNSKAFDMGYELI